LLHAFTGVPSVMQLSYLDQRVVRLDADHQCQRLTPTADLSRSPNDGRTFQLTGFLDSGSTLLMAAISSATASTLQRGTRHSKAGGVCVSVHDQVRTNVGRLRP
jgi:hypothetical protein